MKKRLVALLLFLLVVLMSGCKTTGKAASDVCDTKCQQERDAYISDMNDFLVQANAITSKVSAWRTITKEDLVAIAALRDKVSALNVPKDFELVHDYYTRAFNHYVEAVTKIVNANNEYSSDVSNVAAHNIAMTIVINNVQEANRILIYADEESKFATRLVSSF